MEIGSALAKMEVIVLLSRKVIQLDLHTPAKFSVGFVLGMELILLLNVGAGQVFCWWSSFRPFEGPTVSL